MARLKVNNTCNVRTGDDTANPRMQVDITIPRYRATLNIAEAEALARDITCAVIVAKEQLVTPPDVETLTCAKCGASVSSAESFDDEGEGEEAGRMFHYCSEHCRETH